MVDIDQGRMCISAHKFECVGVYILVNACFLFSLENDCNLISFYIRKKKNNCFH